MRFQILHESRGRVRLRAMQRVMSMAEADLLEAWILALPGVDRVTVHERICGVTILFTGEREGLSQMQKDLIGHIRRHAETLTACDLLPS